MNNLLFLARNVGKEELYRQVLKLYNIIVLFSFNTFFI